MNTIFLIAKKELASFLNTSWGLSIFAIILLLDDYSSKRCTWLCPRHPADVLEDFFYFSSGTTMIAGILLTETLGRRTPTWYRAFLTAPIQESHIVVGKF